MALRPPRVGSGWRWGVEFVGCHQFEFKVPQQPTTNALIATTTKYTPAPSTHIVGLVEFCSVNLAGMFGYIYSAIVFCHDTSLSQTVNASEAAVVPGPDCRPLHMLNTVHYICRALFEIPQLIAHAKKVVVVVRNGAVFNDSRGGPASMYNAPCTERTTYTTQLARLH